MGSAIIKIRTQVTPLHNITDKLVGIPGVIDVYPVEGNYNLVVLLDSADPIAGKSLVQNKILKLDGIQSAELTNTIE